MTNKHELSSCLKQNIGRCPFLMVRAIQVIYYIWQNGSLNGLIECADGKEILLYCGVNGSWVNHTEDTCIEENEEAHNGKIFTV